MHSVNIAPTMTKRRSTPKTDPLVFHIIPSLRMGGAERLAVELCARLPEHGFRTKLLAMYDAGALWQEVRDRNLRWAQLLPTVRGSRLELFRQLRTRIFAEPGRAPQIVHTHLFGADFWSVLAKRWQRIGSQFTAWDVDMPKFMSTAHNIDHDDSFVRRRARRWANHQMDQVIPITKAVETYVQSDLGVPKDQLHLIPNGVDLDRLPIREPRRRSSTPTLIIVGRLELQKGHETLLRALANVHPPWLLQVVGSGSQERTLKELAESLGIVSRIRFLGIRHDIGSLLACADLFLFPSHWEGMGLALMEAMAVGVPSLASDLPSIAEYAPKSMRVKAGDVEAWTKAIRHALKSYDERTALAASLTTKIRKRYGIDRMVEDYVEVYRRFLG
ncbi:glycosyltransferase [Candidatus Uhrbacteria bacterium]|nr:glycosyltransferase [Candidatus Uhrbacteria bacterium]MBD3284026.1 glycosyltransferase [Candidatus Uhrbacteria bacterium]